MLKRIIIAFSLLLIFKSIFSQESKNKPIVSVNLDIIGKGAPTACARVDTSGYYFVTVNVLNTQDTTVSFFIMSCEWAMDGFVIQSDSVAFQFCFRGCDHNVPEKISLSKGQSVQFYGTIKSWKKDLSVA